VLVVRPDGTDRVRVDFLNPDGSVAFCGNGTRCAARYAAARGYCGDRPVLVTSVGEVPAEIRGGRVRLVLPPPKDRGRLSLSACGARHDGRWVDSGVPHFVVEAEDAAKFPLVSVGPVLRADPAWGAAGANVDVVSRDADGSYHVRTWERGVENETLACGTGAIAAALSARLAGAPETVRIVPASGAITVERGKALPGSKIPTMTAQEEAALSPGARKFVAWWMNEFQPFFEKLSTPGWIQPLEEEAVFAEPPQLIREGDLISFPFWPQSRYLTRMASLAPEEVMEAILRIPATDNTRIHEDFIGAALIIVVVFAGFAAGKLVMFQQMGFGVAVALLIDATIIRSVMLPAAMRLLGSWNWYLPSWLEWLPRVEVEAAPREKPVPIVSAGS
jgi:diaminopimelate epimerase